jgi:hypothetical protein
MGLWWQSLAEIVNHWLVAVYPFGEVIFYISSGENGERDSYC